jgi:hypothetical protein
LEREYALAKGRLDRESEALEFRKDALTAATTSPTAISDVKTESRLAMMDDARAKLEVVADRAQDLLTRFRGGEMNERATMRELKYLLEGAKDGDCDFAGLCKMVAALDFTGSTTGEAVQVEMKTVKKRKVVTRSEQSAGEPKDAQRETNADIKPKQDTLVHSSAYINSEVEGEG